MTQSGDRHKNHKRMIVAETILAQMGGMKRLALMIGAKDWVGGENYLQFGFKGSRWANKCTVTLDANDTYTMEFFKFPRDPMKITKTSFNAVSSDDGLYCDMLVKVFESETGLYLSLGTMKQPS